MRHFRLIVALFVIAALVTATAGYDAVHADRSIDVAVSSDADAYLAVEPVEKPVHLKAGQTVAAVRITNQFDTTLDLTARVVDSESLTVEVDSSDALGPGHTTDLLVSCRNTGEYAVDLEIEAVGNGVSVTVVEPIEVSCHQQSTPVS